MSTVLRLEGLQNLISAHSRDELKSLLIDHLSSLAGFSPLSIEVREYPDEVTFVLYVNPHDFRDALNHVSHLEDLIQDAEANSFVVIRRAQAGMVEEGSDAGPVSGVHDQRASALIRLVGARSRVSSVQPSLVYITDARASIDEVSAERHHLIFGRRGAGKSALLVEAKRVIEGEGAIASWSNVQTLRQESPQRVFLYVVQDLLEQLISNGVESSDSPNRQQMNVVLSDVARLLYRAQTSEADANAIVPRIQRVLSKSFEITGQSSFIFLDDFYFLRRDVQPYVLELLHACSRDSSVWLKIGSIKHLTNWWQASPPLGLQTGQDTGIIELDSTLQKPAAAREFLVGLLQAYAQKVGVRTLGNLFAKGTLDRLVLASGAVPRDFLVLATDSIVRARRRASARFVGIQDVNQAAGDAASVKIQELEEDMASNSGEAERTLGTLSRVKDFCLHERGYTYFLIGYRDRESNPEWYSRLTDLMDVRLIHIVEPSVSDPHAVGERLEAFMLDLSQYTGARLKQNLIVLDFDGGKFLSRATRGRDDVKVGSTSRELISILRGAPRLELSSLAQTPAA